MTPSRTGIMWATPRCHAQRMVRDGQHGVHFTCLEPMRYMPVLNMWRCVACGASVLATRIQEAA
jgi:hypothetical protein